MLDSPLLTPETLDAAAAAAFPPMSRESHDARRNGDARAHAAVCAFLAAQDPEALALAFDRTRHALTLRDTALLEKAFRWLGLGGDDA